MIESYLEDGNQPMPKDPSQMKYGVSITDKCISWATTERILREAHARLKKCGGRKIG
jgi:3-deoxy-7-phosphoheptulonate synthase